MNKMLRQLFVAVIVLFTILGLSSSIITAIRANELTDHPRNVLELSHKHGTQRRLLLTYHATTPATPTATQHTLQYQHPSTTSTI